MMELAITSATAGKTQFPMHLSRCLRPSPFTGSTSRGGSQGA